MNVVLVAPFGLAPKGTVSRRMLPLARALPRDRITGITIVIPSWDDPPDAGRTWTDQGVEIVSVPLRGGVPGVLAALLRTTAAQRPDLVHCFKPKGYPGLVLWLLHHARQAGLWSGRLLVDADDWETGWNDRLAYAAPLPTLFAWQENWCLRHADGVTVASRWLQRLAAGLRGSGRDVRRVPNGVDSGRPAALAGPPGPRPPTVLLYTRFVEVTPQRVLRTWRLVRQYVTDAQLIVAGDSLPPGQAAQLAVLAGRTAGMRCLGWVPAPALPGVLAAADVAWVPSAATLVARARCPVKLVELMSAGLPVVADALGEVPTYVRHDIEGVLVTGGNDAASAQALASLLSDRRRATAYGQAAAARVRTEFAWDHLARRVAAFYTELAA